MSAHSSGAPPIPAAPAGTRPFWSVMIPTHDGDELLAETLRSVLVQDPGAERMQIEVVDDHSTRTDPESLVRRVGGDRVGFYRQTSNVGHTANFNTCLARARGEVVHLLHDDDIVREGFYAVLEAALREHPEVGAAFTRFIFSDAQGRWRSFSRLERSTAGVVQGWLATIASGMRITTPAVVVRRDVYEQVGGFDTRIRGGEDWEMAVRIATRYPVWFEPEPLAVYRYARPGSLTGDAVGSTRLVEDMLVATEVVAEYLHDHLPKEEADAALSDARATYGRWSLEAAPALLRRRQWGAAAAAVRVGLAAGPPARMAGTLLAVFAGRALRRLLPGEV